MFFFFSHRVGGARVRALRREANLLLRGRDVTVAGARLQPLLRVMPLLSERDATAAERDATSAERDAAGAERDAHRCIG